MSDSLSLSSLLPSLPFLSTDAFLLWGGFGVLVAAILAFDLGLLHRKQREIRTGEALRLSAFYIALALAFNLGVFWFAGGDSGLAFFTGYVIEKSLSLDNIFVIALIFGTFAVPARFQHRVLFWGILGALAMRGVLILTGSALLAEFHWVVYLFGALLIGTGVKMLFSADKPPDFRKSRIAGLLRRHFRIAEDAGMDGRFLIRRNGLLYGTPLLLALVLVEVTDLIFAIDSVPAVLAITPDPFIVYTSNIFAILGLRSLYFALAGIIGRFAYLKYGLALVLVFAGAKMALTDVYHVPTVVALAVTVLLIGGAVLLSVWRLRRAAHPLDRGTKPAEGR